MSSAMNVALQADIRLSSHDAKLGFNYVKIGVDPDPYVMKYLPKLVGFQQASMILLTGQVLTGTQAKSMGLVLECYDHSAVLTKSIQLARKIATGTSGPINYITKSLRDELDFSSREVK
eukprot:TRINITY_DN7014_c0_g1_i1.p1 TRINITY_DN7014_c0_g1~~TRINITY_DN7014_c0_g1_i1.p1  ORF type:complete len:119 (-),score=12.31 TRINITY_DN7014_c0_g1_i1:317-673(-)